MAEAHKAQVFDVKSFRCFAGKAIEVERRNARTNAEAEAPGKKLPEGWGDGLHYYATIPDPSEL